jgi:hypothetical protein
VFGKKKKKAEPEPGRRIYIPDEHAEKIAELADAYFEKKSCVDHLRLWRFIHEIIPATREGSWALRASGVTRYFVEGKPDE